MKTVTRIFLSLLIGVLILSGCNPSGSKEKENEQTNTLSEQSAVDTNDAAQEENGPKEPQIKEFFDKYVTTDERNIAVMVDNDDDSARPQAGLDEAYLIYEMIIEGGSTRFMAVFRNADTPKIGPIRSSRHYYLDYAMENDVIYTHFGWSPKAMQDIGSFGIDKINGVLGTDEHVFWRERKHKGDWHSAYTSIKNIKDTAQQKGYKTKTEHTGGIKYSDSYISLDSENTANEIMLKYSPKYTTGYSYNSEKGVYEKKIGSKPHVMQNGNTVEVKNIIIELITDTSLGDGSARRNIKTTGSGKGYYITDGKCVEITWEKLSRKENTVYKQLDGTELVINPGKTIVNIINPAAKITIE